MGEVVELEVFVLEFEVGVVEEMKEVEDVLEVVFEELMFEVEI